jgi:DNA replication protein DnaC
VLGEMNEEYIKLLQAGIDSQNAEQGTLNEFDCPICKNKGEIFFLDENNNECSRECECMKKRRIIRNTRNSGLSAMLDKYTFGNFSHKENWQFTMYDKATDFVHDDKAKCFFVGGQIGAGKSHICTAIVGRLLEQGYNAYYNVWNEIVINLKQNAYDNPEEYNRQLTWLKNVKVLYIDDFFKTTPTTADLDKAFQIIDYRKNLSMGNSKRRLITIISSEKMLEEIIGIDEAIGSRIFEMCNRGEYVVEIERSANKNQRMPSQKYIRR